MIIAPPRCTDPFTQAPLCKMTRSEVRGLPVAPLDSYDYVWSEWEGQC